MKAIELAKAFNPKDFEQRIYDLWTRNGCFAPESVDNLTASARLGALPGDGASQATDDPYVIVIPPPNVTGVLHLGHGLNNSLQDVLIRFHRMLGARALWVPGTDHAGIATQSVVEKKLRAQGIRRADIGREKFIEETWKVKHEHHSVITEQLKKIGSSCDWGRERFTMDEGLSAAVREVFVSLYERGLIYRGTYLVNWSVGAQTAIADDEVEFEEVRGKMYKIRYPLTDGSGELRIATTRPETMLGDTAVAVHPADDRYRGLIGKTVTLPLTGRVIPIIADEYVDREFGTGVVKITPAHDFNDYDVGRRHDLPMLNIMNPDGTLNADVPEAYRGLKMQDARKSVVADLEKAGVYDGADEHVHQVGHCYRTHTVVEPYLSEQWFVRMAPLAEKALDAWQAGKIRFYPKRWENTYSHWLKNIRDWCISRQLWWGHRIPVWYDQDTGEMIVSRTDPASDPKYAGRRLKQDDDVLDTWFSSWLWPFSVMGWPDKTADLERFYPTTTLVTAYDIIFFWVARMIMAGLEFMGEVPFRDIYITPLVRDKQGRKMSKTLGNGIDPLEIVDENGADALKFTLSFLSAQGQDILLDKETFGLGSRFANKIWNASRYLLMNIEGRTFLKPADIIAGKNGGLNAADRWILQRLDKAVEGVGQGLLSYRFNDASNAAYEFFWNDFCDWYVEASKLSLYGSDDGEKDRAVSMLLYVLEEGLKILHPFLPFITEEIFQTLPQVADATVCASLGIPAGRLLINQYFPAKRHGDTDNALAEGFSALQELVRAVRTLRSEFTIPPSAKIRFAVLTEGGNREDRERSAFLREQEALIKILCGADMIGWHSTERAGERANKVGAIATVGKGWEAYVYIKDQIDIDAAVARIERTIAKEEKTLQAVRAKLSNEAFVKNAVPEVVTKEKERFEDLERAIGKMRSYIHELRV